MTVAPVGPALPGPAIAPTQLPSFSALLQAHAAPPAAPAAHGGTARPAAAALAHLERAQARLDTVLAAARSGRTFTAAELIGLQAEAYRCAQTVDLASKLAEQGAQAVKQALNTQL